jgi:hypothetical protein
MVVINSAKVLNTELATIHPGVITVVSVRSRSVSAGAPPHTYWHLRLGSNKEMN